MKKSLIFLVLFLSMSGYSFSQKITIKVKKVSIATVLKEIKKRTNIDFFYSDNEINVDKLISVDYKDVEVLKVVEGIIGDKFTVEKASENVIIIKPFKLNQEQITVTGVVKNQLGEPIVGVTVIAKETKKGTSANMDGEFSIPAPSNGTLIFRSLGFVTKEIKIKGRTKIDVVLEENISDLDEVVITGYQTKNKREVSSAVTVLKTKDIDVVGNTSIESMIQGQIAGLDVINATADPGSAPVIRIRGTATLSGNAQPIWVVDGVMLESGVPATPAELNDPDFLKSFNSSIGGLNPNDIESLTILKDASATAIYGTRAANGVVVVTTKKGIKGKPRITYNHTLSIRPRPRYEDFDLMNSQERADFSFELLEDGIGLNGNVGVAYYDGLYTRGGITEEEYIAGIQKVSEMNVDWFDLLFRDATTYMNDISFSGGSDKSNYYASLNQTSSDGLDKVTSYKSYSAMAKINTELSSKLNLGFILNASKRNREQNYTTNAFNYAYSSSRSLPAYNDDGSLYFYGNYYYNILHEQEHTNQTSVQNEIRATLNLGYKIKDWLSYSSLLSYTNSSNVTQQYATAESNEIARQRGYNYGEGSETQIENSSIPFGGQFNQTNFTQDSYLIRNSIFAKFKLVDDLSTDIMVGTEFRNNVYDGFSSTNYGYFYDRGKIFYNPEASEDTGNVLRNSVSRTLYDRTVASYFSTFSAMFKNKYVINANFRFDGSNLFGSNPAYRYLPLWSVSGKWHLEQESFLDSALFIDALSIRASYGLRGNIVEQASPLVISTALAPNSFTLLTEQEIVQPANPDLKWETTATMNLGIDFSLFKRRLAGSIDFFKDLGEDLIATKNISSVTGFETKTVNFANITNEGIDIGLNAKIVSSKDFSYNLGVNVSLVNSKVTKSYIEPSVASLISSTYTVGEVVEGKPVNSMYSYRFSRIGEDGYALFLDEDGNEYGVLDDNFDANIQYNPDALKYEGSRVPTTSIGITNRFNYKNFQLSFLVTSGLNYKIRLQNLAFESEYVEDQYNLRRAVTDRWRQPGDEDSVTIPWLGSSSASYTQANLFNNSDAQVVDGDYIRLRNVLIQYSLPQSFTKAVGISNLTLKLQADNIFVLADKRLNGMDPETANYNTSFWGGALPLPKTFTFGLNLNF